MKQVHILAICLATIIGTGVYSMERKEQKAPQVSGQETLWNGAINVRDKSTASTYFADIAMEKMNEADRIEDSFQYINEGKYNSTQAKKKELRDQANRLRKQAEYFKNLAEGNK